MTGTRDSNLEHTKTEKSRDSDIHNDIQSTRETVVEVESAETALPDTAPGHVKHQSCKPGNDEAAKVDKDITEHQQCEVPKGDETYDDDNEGKARHSQWVHDRTRGKSKVGKGRPPLPCCWVPPPVARCPLFFEQNCFCEMFGRCGVVDADNDRARKIIMGVGLSASLISFILTFYACFAVSRDFDILKAAAFTRGSMNTTTDFLDIDVHIGLRALAVENSQLGNYVINFNDFCNLTRPGLNQTIQEKAENLKYYLQPSACTACDSVSTNLVASVFTSLLTCLLSIFTDVTRMYQNYDVNCQKVFGALISFLSALLSLNTLLQYSNGCFHALFDGQIPFDSQYNILSPQNITQAVAYGLLEWKAGPGFICLGVGTLVKFFDITCHVLLPTPSITRSRQEQAEYERLHAIK